VDYNTITDEVLELFHVYEEANGAVGWRAIHVGSLILTVLDREDEVRTLPFEPKGVELLVFRPDIDHTIDHRW
jgi:hypothetical protein